VGGHGIPASLVEETMAANRKLFSLPIDKKQALLADKNNRGWTPFGEVRVCVCVSMVIYGDEALCRWHSQHDQ